MQCEPEQHEDRAAGLGKSKDAAAGLWPSGDR
jgi:hypothetical protein